jgi:hypothetical protein
MVDKIFGLPWRLVAFGGWLGTLTGILLLFVVGSADVFSVHPFESHLMTFAGWGMAWWGPVAMALIMGMRADD